MNNKEIAKRIVELEFQLRQSDLTKEKRFALIHELEDITMNITNFHDMIEIDEYAMAELSKLEKSGKIDKN